MGAISHVEADFGLDGTPAHDMPLIAKAVSEECRKHLYSSRGNLFIFYQKYMESRKK
jgi:RNA-binding protein YhbY